MEKNRSRLGRGINSLLSVTDLEPPPFEEPSITNALPDVAPHLPGTGRTQPDIQLFHVELSKIVANPHQPRRTFDEGSLGKLAESLKTAGLIQPIVVRQVPGGFELVAGERRLRAARLAGLTTLPALVRSVDSLQQAQLALIENTHREDLNPIDRAQAYRQLMDQLGLTQDELAARLSEDRSSIANFLRLLSLTDVARQGLVDGQISMGHAKILAGIADAATQERLAKLVIEQQLSVRKLEQLVKTGEISPESTPGGLSGTAHIADLEKRLSRALEMRVEIRQSKRGGKGRLSIHYGSLDQFDDLLARLKFDVNE